MVGLAFGYLTLFVLRWLRKGSLAPKAEISFVLGDPSPSCLSSSLPCTTALNGWALHCLSRCYPHCRGDVGPQAWPTFAITLPTALSRSAASLPSW